MKRGAIAALWLVASSCGLLVLCGASGCLVGIADTKGPCRSYVTCAEATGATKGSLDSSYGPMGTCWTTTMEMADACTKACHTGLAALQKQYPDAGCKE